MELQTPDWVRDAVFYQIFPDRFARSALVPKPSNLEAWNSPPTTFGFKGGDLEGVREHLDDIADLGANALYLTPVFTSTANHRYHTFDYFQVDPLLGGNEALRRLLDEAHDRGMRVILDGVFNHASRGFFQFNHTLENGRASPYVDWFHFNQDWLARGQPLNPYGPTPSVEQQPESERSLSLYGYRAWWDIPALPKFNTSLPAVREFLWRVAEHWIGFGIDGWRLDVPNEIDDDEFWREFRRRVRKVNPEAYLVGEIWGDASRWLAGDQFDGAMNYPFTKASIGFCLAESLNYEQFARCGYSDLQPLTAPALAATLEESWRRYARAAVHCQLNIVGSHDTPRLLNVGLGDADGVKLVYVCLFGFPGAPCVYYGDEIGMAGDHDPDNRRGFEWDRSLWNHELRAHVRACARARFASPALRRGDFRVLIATGGVIVTARQEGDHEAIVAVNASLRDQDLVIPVGQLRATIFKPQVGAVDPVGVAFGEVRLLVRARTGVILTGQASA